MVPFWHLTCIRYSFGAWNIYYHKFALSVKFCPSGSPGQTTEESAAHHFLLKTLLEIPGTSFLNVFFKFRFSQKSCMWTPKSPGVDIRKITFRHNGYIFLTLDILRILIYGVVLTFDEHSILIWCLNYFSPHICVELETLPFGLPKTNDRGVCCAPFSSKSTFRNTWDFIF